MIIHKIPPYWNLSEALDIVRQIEAAILPTGYHCALGGGVLHQGYSEKDLDIFIYPHNGKSLAPGTLRNGLEKHGFKCKSVFGRSKDSHDSKEIELWLSPDGKRIDFFFVQ